MTTDEHDAATCATRRFADQAVDKLEELLEEGFLNAEGELEKPTSEMLAHAWQHITEACLLRLTRLKPEMVKRLQVGWDPAGEGGDWQADWIPEPDDEEPD